MKFVHTEFERIAHEKKFTDPLEEVICNEHVTLCSDFDLTQFQESWSWRNAHTARTLAQLIIDDQGGIDKKNLLRAIKLLEANLYSLGPDREGDATRQCHLLKILKLFYEKKEYLTALKRISKPSGHPGAEKIIRETLFLVPQTIVTDVHARQAALSALMVRLRQNVGSCFATAPAILIQQDQPLQFLFDIGQLFGTGRLNRIYQGVEYSVPMSTSWGMGDLLRPITLSAFGKNPLKLISLSPGLQAAFEAAELIKSRSRPERRKLCFDLLKEGGVGSEIDDPFFLISAEAIIKKVLLRKYEVSELDVHNYKVRSVQGPRAELVYQTPSILGSKSIACSRYLAAYERAIYAFKSLTDNALLKSWEFSLASLSESKSHFAKWNLYASLGVDPQEPFGIGESLHRVIEEKIREINAEIELFQSRYDHLFAQARYLEGRIGSASEKEIGWIRAEYQIRRHEINRALSERDEVYEKGKKLQGLYPILIDFYGEKIGEYFQEVYDAEMHDLSANPYDDSPAGFRLMYKHGRSNTAVWTMVHSPSEYIQYLTSFFISTERELGELDAVAGLKKELSELVTAAIMTIKTPEFLEYSCVRLARAYREPIPEHPLENLDKVKRKPWSYVSGGTMTTLVQCYWGDPNPLQEAKRWIENEREYLAFLIDTLKELPLSQQKMYQQESEKNLLAFSPTHAFLCKPGLSLLRKAWESDSYTYTWIRDQWVVKQQRFLDQTLLDQRMMDLIIHQLLQFIPLGYRPIAAHSLSHFTYSMTPPEFREAVIKNLAYEKWLREGRRLEIVGEEIDSILYSALPLFPEYALQERLMQVFETVDEIDAPLRTSLIVEARGIEERIGKYHILTAKQLKEIALVLLMRTLNTTRTRVPFPQKITEALQLNGLCYPEPILFADTNWIKNMFGFIINPGTAALELWRFSESGSEGRPMNVWKRYLNGMERIDWGFYINPAQYGQFS